MNAAVWIITLLVGIGGFGLLGWLAGRFLWKAIKDFFDRYSDSLVAEKLAKAEAVEAHETNERISNDVATAKSVTDTVDNLSDASVHSMLESDWKSPKQ